MPADFTREGIAQRAQLTAARLVATLGGGGLAARFVRSYAKANRRRALLVHIARYRELINRISREALLAMAARVESDLSRQYRQKLPRRRKRVQRPGNSGEAVLANHFRVEFYGRLAELLDWRREELEDFWRDLDLYTGAARVTRPRRLLRRSCRRKPDPHLGAFADRCAFLLDSSLLERARRAAGKLHRELDRTAHQATTAAFRRARVRGIIARPRPGRIGRSLRRFSTQGTRHTKRSRKRGGRR